MLLGSRQSGGSDGSQFLGNKEYERFMAMESEED